MKSGEAILKEILNGSISSDEDLNISDTKFKEITEFHGQIESESKIYTFRRTGVIDVTHVNVIVIPDKFAEKTNRIKISPDMLATDEFIPVFIYFETEKKFKLKQVCRKSDIDDSTIEIKPQTTELEYLCCLLKTLKKGAKIRNKQSSPEVWKMSGVQDKDLLFLRNSNNPFHCIYSQALESRFHNMLKLEEFSKTGREVICNVGVDEQGRLLISSCRNLNMLRISNAYMNDAGEVYSRNNALDYVFKPFYYNLLIDLKELQKNYNNSLELCPGDLIKLKLFNATNKDNQSCSHLIEAKVCYAASNYTTKEIKAEFIKKITNDPNDPFIKEAKQKKYNSPTKTEADAKEKLQEALNEITDNEKRLLVRINRVGQANLILLYSKMNNFEYAVDYGIPLDEYINDKRKVFDLTTKRDVNNDTVNYDYLCQRTSKFKTVLITHWHTDHYNGLFLLDKSHLDDIVVFAPNYCKYSDYGDKTSENNENLRLLINYLEKNSRIYCLSSFSSISNNNNSNVTISVTKNSPKYNTSKHGNCLLVKISGQNRNGIFPGDCGYILWPDSIKSDKYDFIVIPHHGSKDSIEYNDLRKIHKPNAKAYVCTGINNYTGNNSKDDKTHPYHKWVSNWSTIKDLTMRYTNIRRFDKDNKVEKYILPSEQWFRFIIK